MARPRSDIRERLVEAARSRFRVRGVDGASLRDIARDAGTSVGIVAYWFPKKSDLFDEVVESAYGPIVADVARLLDEHVSTRERLHAVVLRIAKASTEEIDGLRLIAREAIGSASRRRRIVRRFMKGHVRYRLSAMHDGVKRGELDASIPLPVILAAFIALAAIPGRWCDALPDRRGSRFRARKGSRRSRSTCSSAPSDRGADSPEQQGAGSSSNPGESARRRTTHPQMA